MNRIIVDDYKENINKLAKGSDEKVQSGYWLERFMQKLIYEKLNATLTADTIIENASLFISEMELSQSKYTYTCYLDGLFIEPDNIPINSNCFIRKIQRSDLEYKGDIFPGFHLHYSEIPSSILEVKLSANNEQECRKYIERIQNCLRLYRLCSVYSIFTKHTKKSIICPIGEQIMGRVRNYDASNKYTIKISEIDIFIKFVNLILERSNFDVEEKENRTLFISFDRYNLALLEALDIDRKIMMAIMGLEALFTFEKDRGENAFKLGIRVAKLLDTLDYESFTVRELIEGGYNFRNKVVHGSYISPDKQKRMAEIFPKVINYLRVALIVFLLNKDTGKEKMIELLEKSMINEDQNKVLKGKIEESVKEFRELFS